MDTQGIVFDIKELALFDGPGIRTTVFLKGCPLRCQWCHNPEGISPQPQLMVAKNTCQQCGACVKVCNNKSACTLCAKCVRACPIHARKMCGTKYTSSELAKKISNDETYLKAQKGGVTFSGGEPTLQGNFLIETLKKLKNMHTAIETCGHCQNEIFAEMLKHIRLVLFDIKIADSETHKFYTGVTNKLILQNLNILKQSSTPFIARIPLIPTVTDTNENLLSIAKLLCNCPNLQGVELLPYHKTAGAKYTMVGKTYNVSFNENAIVNAACAPFELFNIPCKVLGHI